ncbi:hypothetical protein BT63DRAFT_140832 [Microthyrium microscopicum]|uniref:Uncharacterized protein n=1 Tax=Microthyrium microscopicum TaxID=703497 RepID=A0A6A6UPV7_9PEZI|nr:hypothetical protein BT63DRAFT_140832 [Microthyrium microscopicum]
MDPTEEEWSRLERVRLTVARLGIPYGHVFDPRMEETQSQQTVENAMPFNFQPAVPDIAVPFNDAFHFPNAQVNMFPGPFNATDYAMGPNQISSPLTNFGGFYDPTASYTTGLVPDYSDLSYLSNTPYAPTSYATAGTYTPKTYHALNPFLPQTSPSIPIEHPAVAAAPEPTPEPAPEEPIIWQKCHNTKLRYYKSLVELETGKIVELRCPMATAAKPAKPSTG